MRWGKQYEEDKIISKDILIYICNDAFNFLYSALVDFPNCACPKCSCHEYISDKCRGEHFVRSRYAPAHYSNHVENISDFYTLLRHYTLLTVEAHQIQAGLTTHAACSGSLGAGYSAGVVDTGALGAGDDLYKSFWACSEDRKYFSGASGIKIADKEHPAPCLGDSKSGA